MSEKAFERVLVGIGAFVIFFIALPLSHMIVRAVWDRFWAPLLGLQ